MAKKVSKSLEEIPEDALRFPTTSDERGNDILQFCFGFVSRVRVIEVTRGLKKMSV